MAFWVLGGKRGYTLREIVASPLDGHWLSPT